MKEPNCIEHFFNVIQHWLLNYPYSLFEILLSRKAKLWDKVRYFLLTGRIWR